MKQLMPLMLIGLAAPAIAQRGPMNQGPQTRSEFQAAEKARFASFDANHDGIVTKAEVSAAMEARMGNPPPAEMLDRMFGRMDPDGDGKVSAAEADTVAMARFDTVDANKDGTLTPEERRAGMQGMRMSRPPQQ